MKAKLDGTQGNGYQPLPNTKKEVMRDMFPMWLDSRRYIAHRDIQSLIDARWIESKEDLKQHLQDVFNQYADELLKVFKDIS